MAEDDNFDIDIYGDDAGNDYQGEPEESMQDAKPTDQTATHVAVEGAEAGKNEMEVTPNNGEHDAPNKAQLSAPQGTKRKVHDDRRVDPNATASIVLGELHWWTTEDDIRGWINKSGCEDELKDISFNEHKVNGKSKGQAFVEFSSPQASTAFKHHIDAFATSTDSSPAAAALKKHTANYHPSGSNPYRTLPKDVPGRNRDSGREGHSRPQYNQQAGNYGGFNRGGRGGFGGRGGSAGGYGNRNFSGGPVQGGAMQGGNFSGMGGNFAGGPMNQFNAGFNRGGMMGGGGMRGGMGGSGRGGRGGAAMGPGMMGNMGMPMGNMGMPNMNMGMGGMGGMGMGAMGMAGFNNPQHFGAGGFFNQGQQSGGDGNWNPHGAKRPRPE